MAKLLLVDDEPGVLNALSVALRIAGFEVETAADGLAGMARYRAGRPDLVITDIIMPHREGIGFIVELRGCDPALPIIALSGGGRTRKAELLDTAAKLGASATLRKPVPLAELLAAVQRCLGAAAPATSPAPASFAPEPRP